MNPLAHAIAADLRAIADSYHIGETTLAQLGTTNANLWQKAEARGLTDEVAEIVRRAEIRRECELPVPFGC